MAEVTLTVGGREYRVTCRPGGEERLRQIAAILDDKAADAIRALGDMGEARQLLFAALLMGDELMELREGKIPPADPQIVGAVEALADRIESLAAALETRARKA
jgi:cell division protein ZapA